MLEGIRAYECSVSEQRHWQTTYFSMHSLQMLEKR